MEGYNGWSNYETWCVKLWLDNDYGTYTLMRALANKSESTYELSQEIKEYCEGMMPDLGASMFSDLLGRAFGAVDWYEIAENYEEDNYDA